MYSHRKAERGGTRQISKIYRALVTGIIGEDKVMPPSLLLIRMTMVSHFYLCFYLGLSNGPGSPVDL